LYGRSNFTFQRTAVSQQRQQMSAAFPVLCEVISVGNGRFVNGRNHIAICQNAPTAGDDLLLSNAVPST
jgi:hypothetical protein